MKNRKKTKIAFILITVFLLITPLFFNTEKKHLDTSEVYNLHGINTTLLDIKGTDVVFIKFKIKDAGVFHNRTEQHGISLIVASLMFRKMSNLSEKQTREKLQKLTISNLTADAMADDFEISFYVLKDHLTDALDFLGNAIVHPNFTENDLEYVKSLYPHVIDLETSTPHEIMNDELMKMLFYSSGYGLNQTGTIQGIASIKANDIQNFIDKNFVKSRLNVFVVGSLSRFDTLQYLNPFFEKLSTSNEDNVVKFNVEKSKENGKHIYKKEMGNIVGITLGIRLDALSDHEKAIAKILVSTLFSIDGDFKKSLEMSNINCVTNAELIERNYSSIFRIISYVDKKDLKKYIDFVILKLKKYSTTQNLIHLEERFF